jgi:thioredoxin 1
MNKLLKISQNRCRPCFMLSNYLNEKGIQHEEALMTDELLAKYDLSGVPVLLLLDEDEQELARTVGFDPENTTEVDELISLLND